METTCPQCGKAIDPRSDYCASCNAPVNAANASSQAPAAAPQPSDPDRAICSLCKAEYNRNDMINFGGTLVCAGCKPAYVSMIEQGNVRPGVRYAGFWIRFAAKFLDGLLLGVANAIIGLIFGAAVATMTDPVMQIVIFLIQFLLQLAIAVTFVTFFIGKFQATPGKMACGIIVVNPEGGKISYGRAFGRYFGEMLSGLTLGVGYIMAGFDDEKRALHDRVCATRVIYK